MCDGCRCQSVERYEDAICKIKVDSRRRLCTSRTNPTILRTEKKSLKTSFSLRPNLSLPLQSFVGNQISIWREEEEGPLLLSPSIPSACKQKLCQKEREREEKGHYKTITPAETDSTNTSRSPSPKLPHKRKGHWRLPHRSNRFPCGDTVAS